VVQFTAYLGEKPWVWTLNRQTTLPPVSEGRASGAALRAPSPPSGRGVCLISSSCPGPQTTMTGSELAGHRLPGSARRVVLRTALLAQRGGAGPPLKRPPPPALRASSLAPDGAQTPLLMERRSAPSGGGQSVAIGPGRGDRRVSLRPVYGGSVVPSIMEQTRGQPLRREAATSEGGRPKYQNAKK